MGHESFVDWISPEIALAYFISATVVLTGVLQIAGAHWDRPELRWLRSRRLSTLFGALLIAGATAAFYLGMHRLIFVPGLAGTELMVLFSAAALVATLLVRLAARLGAFRSATPERTEVAATGAPVPAVHIAAPDQAPAVSAARAASPADVAPRPQDSAPTRFLDGTEPS